MYLDTTDLLWSLFLFIYYLDYVIVPVRVTPNPQHGIKASGLDLTYFPQILLSHIL